MANDEFFENSHERSKIKSEIVGKYFWAWANVLLHKSSDRIAYIDLYSGPGAYRDGTPSTPILILQKALETPAALDRFVSIFNDINPKHAASLQKAVDKIPDILKLKYKPSIRNEQVGEQIINLLKPATLVPTLLFLDPWGYKGLSSELIGSVLKDWGCDCIFFFNYNRINAAVSNPVFQDHVNDIFGKDRANVLRENVKGISAAKREDIVMTALKESLKEIRGHYMLPFKFFSDDGTKTSHFLILVSKNELAYNIMKGIMAPLSSKIIDGVSFFEFNPNPPINMPDLQLSLFGEATESPLKTLEKELLSKFSGRKLTMHAVFLAHNVNTNYISRNYKDVLIDLEERGIISAFPNIANRRVVKGHKTFGDDVIITFPKSE